MSLINAICSAAPSSVCNLVNAHPALAAATAGIAAAFFYMRAQENQRPQLKLNTPVTLDAKDVAKLKITLRSGNSSGESAYYPGQKIDWHKTDYDTFVLTLRNA